MRSLQLLTLAFLATAAKADPFLGPYSVMPCSGCSIVPGGGDAPPQDFQGLNNAAFVQFFRGLDDGLTNPTFSWGVTGDSADGYIVGNVDGGDAIDTGFIYRDGVLSCCTIDFPFHLIGINNQDVIIGYDPTYGPFIAPASSGENEYPLGEIVPSLGGEFDGRNSYFLAIDDQNRILADINGQEDMLVPTPEPPSWCCSGLV